MARRDLRRQYDFYRGINGELALDIAERIERKVAWIADLRFDGSPVAGRLRKSRVAKTPFLIFFRLHPRYLQIVRIRHRAENWLAR